jgi:DNA helicase II / ATP-dependent DNA helicase PcrA
MSAATAYLDTLNSEQRRAVEHGVTELDYNSGGPLLVIAGAGSGKTNTLAHREATAAPISGSTASGRSAPTISKRY